MSGSNPNKNHGSKPHLREVIEILTSKPDSANLRRQTAVLRRKALEEGRALRRKVPRSIHAVWKPPTNRPDPVALLLQTGRRRLSHLLPLRYGRMSQSAFTLMRGAAAL